jgi:hypothetical protein
MCVAERSDDGAVELLWVDGLETELGNAFLSPALADARARAFTAAEGPRALRVPRTALVIADAAGPRGKESVANRVE